MKFVTTVAAALAALSSSAFAADMPAKAAAAPAAVAAPTWTGAYIGLGVGARILDPDWTTTEMFNPIGGPYLASTETKASFSDTAFRGSVFAGYNWQINPTWVWGIEGDFGWAANKERVSRIPGLGLPGSGSFTEVKGDWDASLRVRAGMLINPSLLGYVTGGVAWQHVKATATCPADFFVCNPALGRRSFSESDTRTGWTIGAGIEAMWTPNWLVRAEYRYADFGDFSFVAIPFEAGASFGAKAKLDTTSHTLTVGLARKF